MGSCDLNENLQPVTYISYHHLYINIEKSLDQAIDKAHYMNYTLAGPLKVRYNIDVIVIGMGCIHFL